MSYRKFRRRAGIAVLAVILVYFILMIPMPESRVPASDSKAFSWNRDSLFLSLEKRYKEIKTKGRVDAVTFQKFQLQGDSILNLLNDVNLKPSDTVFQNWLDYYLFMAPIVAADSSKVGWYYQQRQRMRRIQAEQSAYWSKDDMQARITRYKLVYGSRAALEEVFLQQDEHFTFPFSQSIDSTGASDLFGVKVKDGDILLSRGGAPVSAFISRANDFPGNFSHVALLHVDSKTRRKKLIVAHIEKVWLYQTRQLILRIRNYDSLY